MAMTHDTINAMKNACSEVLGTLKNAFYFVNLLQFLGKLGCSQLNPFFLVLAKLFYSHVYNIILVLGEAVPKSETKNLHSFMRK